MLVSIGELKMKQNEHIVPKIKLMKKMNNLILDNQSEEIKLLLFKRGQSIPSLYNDINFLLKHNKIHISKSTFKNMLMDSSTQQYKWETRLKVISVIYEYLNPENINAEYEGIKLDRDKKIRSLMKLLEADYKDKREYLPIEVLRHAMENIPDDMKTYWESWREE